MKCSLCEKEKKLVKAHIVPESFYRRIKTGNEPLKIVTDTKGIHTKKSQIGIYDKQILCSDCEGTLEIYDNYAANVLINNLDSFVPINHQGRTIAYRLDNYDYPKLKLFFLSIIWRASVSKHNFYQRVYLGPYEIKARDLIITADPGEENDFSTLLSCWESKESNAVLTKTMMDPFKEKWDDINAYRIYFGYLVAYIKVDKRPFRGSMSRMFLKEDRPIYLVNRNLEESNDFKAMMSVAKSLRLKHNRSL